MRILRVAQKAYPDVMGGGAYHVHAMSRDQAARGHDVTVLTVARDGEQPRHEERDGYTLVREPSAVELLGNEVSPGVARFLYGADDYDVIHAHSHLYFSTNLAALKRRIGNTPLAVTNHGLYSQHVPEWLFDLYLRSIGRWTFDNADVVFCYTEEDRSRVRDVGVRSTIEVVPNGIDTARFTPDGMGSDLLESDGFAVLFVGRLVEGKRPQDAIEAVARVREGNPDLDPSLYLAGDGPLRPELERRVSDRGMEDAVSFLGQVPYGEMPRVYRSADVLLLPSRAEGLPRTVLEALSTGCPVVTSDLEQLRSITREAGIDVPVGETAEFAAALETLLRDTDLRRRLGARGRELIDGRYTWASTVEETTQRLIALGSYRN